MNFAVKQTPLLMEICLHHPSSNVHRQGDLSTSCFHSLTPPGSSSDRRSNETYRYPPANIFGNLWNDVSSQLDKIFNKGHFEKFEMLKSPGVISYFTLGYVCTVATQECQQNTADNV